MKEEIGVEAEFQPINRDARCSTTPRCSANTSAGRGTAVTALADLYRAVDCAPRSLRHVTNWFGTAGANTHSVAPARKSKREKLPTWERHQGAREST